MKKVLCSIVFCCTLIFAASDPINSVDTLNSWEELPEIVTIPEEDPPKIYPPSGSISIEANVDSARVLVNRSPAGFTPLVKTGLEPGDYEIIVLKSGYQSFRKSLSLSDGEQLEIVSQLIAIEVEEEVVKSEVVVVDRPAERVVESEISISPKRVRLIVGSTFVLLLSIIGAFELSGVGQ